MLELNDVTVAYGAVEAVRGVTLTLERGSIAALLGTNGAGKSSTVKAINGLVRPIGGTVAWDGHDLSRASPASVARAGVVTVPEGREIFGPLSVMENLRLGAYRVRRDRSKRAALDRVFDYYPVLAQRSSQVAHTLSGGEQQMLVIGRALMAQPELILLDEPSLGLAPKIVAEVYRTLRDICQDIGLTALVVEQDVTTVLSVATEGHVMESGRIIASGSAEQIGSDPSLREIYLGS